MLLLFRGELRREGGDDGTGEIDLASARDGAGLAALGGGWKSGAGAGVQVI